VGRPDLALALLAFYAFTGSAAEVEGEIHARHPENEPGRALEGPLVVYFTGFAESPPSTPVVITQRNKTFVPSLQVIVEGQSIVFTNEDNVVHNVFSTSKARPFDLGKPAVGEAREVPFKNPGLVEIYCNIHENMFATVLVLPNHAFAIADSNGHFVIRGVPPGRHLLHAWSHHIEPFATEVFVPVTGTTRVEIEVTARVFYPTHLDKFGRPYAVHVGYTQ
jgi:plastocyanin